MLSITLTPLLHIAPISLVLLCGVSPALADLCPAGRAGPSCGLCPAGQHSHGPPGAHTRVALVAHPYALVDNATCTSGPAHAYVLTAGSIACVSATSGWYAAEPRATAQTLCAPRSYNDAVGTVSSGTPLLR
jgi:hypothetical protein